MADARARRDDARQQIQNDLDPNDTKRVAKVAKTQSQEDSFKALALEWFAQRQAPWSDSHRDRVNRMLHKDLFPQIGRRPIGEIPSPELLSCLRKIEKRGVLETARRVKQVAGQVFRYAVASSKADRDPSVNLKDALATPIKSHLAAITDPKEVGRLLLTLDDYQGTPEGATALKLAPLFFCRPKELRHMEWSEIDFDKQQWHIPANKMKMKADHIVPLCKQAIEELTGHRQYIFPSTRSPKRPMSDNAVLAEIRRLGIPKEKMTGHGFRAMATTLLDEELGY